MVKHPVESGRAHDAIKCPLERQVQQIAGQQAHARAKLDQVLARRAQHVLREINADYAPARQGFEKISGKPAGAAARIENTFIPAQPQS